MEAADSVVYRGRGESDPQVAGAGAEGQGHYRDNAYEVSEGAGTGQVCHPEAVQHDTSDGGVFPCRKRKNADSGSGISVRVGGPADEGRIKKTI